MFKRILVPVDFSDVTHLLVDHATEMAKVHQAELRLLHVEPHPEILAMALTKEEIEETSHQPGGEQYTLDRLIERISENGVKADSTHLTGDPGKKIIVAAEEFEADLIILGSHGHGKFYHLLGGGGVRDLVVEDSRFPVLIIRNTAPGPNTASSKT